jgi:hypothetical protein
VNRIDRERLQQVLGVQSDQIAIGIESPVKPGHDNCRLILEMPVFGWGHQFSGKSQRSLAT